MNTAYDILRMRFAELVAQANGAPSVHNIQPALWQAEPTKGVIHLTADSTRTLPVGDPGGHDMAISLGAAAEGMALALSTTGLATEVIPENSTGTTASYQFAIRDGGKSDPLFTVTEKRMTWRGSFLEAASSEAKRLASIADTDDVTLLTAPADLANIADLNDAASMRFFRHTEYRKELLSWMRFSGTHPGWRRDGLNAEAMVMSGLEARIAGWLLSKGPFEFVDRLGLMNLLMSEKSKVKSATGVMLFHRPRNEVPFLSGRRFYRLWLEITAAGFDACPMAVLADDADTNWEICLGHDIHDDRRLINAFRVGLPPANRQFRRVRLPASETILPSE